MSVTPVDVHNVVFKECRLGARGYDVDEVDAFLDVVEAELARLIAENNELRAVGSGTTSVRPGTSSQPGTGPTSPAGQPPHEDDGVRASRILVMATETAERYVDEAKAEAEEIVRGATSSSERLTADARQKSEQMVALARERAGSMISDARTRAAEVEREARAHAAALQEAERRHVEAVSLLEEKRSRLEGTIEELGTSEREYRTRLRHYLESRLRDLAGGGSDERAPVSAMVTV